MSTIDLLSIGELLDEREVRDEEDNDLMSSPLLSVDVSVVDDESKLFVLASWLLAVEKFSLVVCWAICSTSLAI